MNKIILKTKNPLKVKEIRPIFQYIQDTINLYPITHHIRLKVYKKDNTIIFTFARDLEEHLYNNIYDFITKNLDVSFDLEYFGEKSFNKSSIDINAINNSMKKELHQTFMKKKFDKGWRYGSEYSEKDKTSPELLSLEHIADNFDFDFYRKFKDLINSQGYDVFKK